MISNAIMRVGPKATLHRRSNKFVAIKKDERIHVPFEVTWNTHSISNSLLNDWTAWGPERFVCREMIR